MRRPIFIALIFVSFFTFVSCTSEAKISHDINNGWKRSMKDDMSFANPDYDDSNWETVDKPCLVAWDNPGEHYCWVRKTISIPADLQNDEVYIGFGKGNAAAAIYANGTYVGSRGYLPPNYVVRTEYSGSYLIPKNCIINNKVTIALRLYTQETDISDMHLTLDNSAKAYFENLIHNIFNQRIFLLMAVICMFMAVYSMTQYISSKDIAYLMFCVCLLFICYYFYDMGCEKPILPYALHRVLSRASLTISMGFLVLFLASFFKRTYFKKLAAIVAIIQCISLIIYLVNIGRNSVINNIFTILLIPTFASIVYGYVVIIKAVKKHMFGSTQLIIGFIGGSIFAINDIVSQIRGVTPFMWTQGIAFFAIDMAIFIALAGRDGSNQKRIQKLAKTTVEQKDRLSDVFKNAKSVAGETAEISHSLSESVNAVNDAVDSTQSKVEEIKTALEIQGKSQQETASAINNLTGFLNSMSQQFETQSKMIQVTATKINEVIDGIQNVGDGVLSAAEFSSGLSGITSSSSGDMKKLLDEMEKVQDSSQEILGVVTTLDTFAQQTNLLAMNASIEAAHSGEFGKGFAVIAREIKDLASQTSQWSAKIGEIITVVISQIQHSVELCTKVNESLSKINHDSQESAIKVGAASKSVIEQQEAGKVIAKESADLATLAEKMQEALKEQKTFAANVSKNMESLINASKDVDNASREIYNVTNALYEESRNLINLAKRTNESSESLTKIMS